MENKANDKHIVEEAINDLLHLKKQLAATEEASDFQKGANTAAVLFAESINARLTRLEEQIKTGVVVSAAPAGVKQQPAAEDYEDDDRPPMPDDDDAPPLENEMPVADDTPIGFWMDVAAAVRQELRPPVTGFFAPTPNAPVQGVLRGSELIIQCQNAFTLEMVNKPEILALVERKASAKLGRPVRVKAADRNDVGSKSKQMEQLLSFGRAHGDIVKIKED